MKTIIVALFLSLLVFTPQVVAQSALTGDANGDGVVNNLDYDHWLNNYGSTVSTGFSMGDFNNDKKTDGVDYILWITNFGLSVTPTAKPTSSSTVTPPTTTDNSTSTNIVFRHPYQFGNQPALVYSKFNVAYWIDNWDISPTGKSLRFRIEKTGVKNISYDELATPWDTYKLSGPNQYNIATCDAPVQTISDTIYRSKDLIPVTGLVDGTFYKLTLELLKEDGTSSGISTSACVEVNSPFLTSLVHVNDTSGTSGGGQSPVYLNSLKQQAASDLVTQGDIPSCPNHDPKVWHAIYDPIRKCHYDHEHKDDPNRNYFDNSANKGRDGTNRGAGDALSVFGPLWAWIPDKYKAQLPTSQSISYPWQTWSGTDLGNPPATGKMENELKHNGYTWMVRTPDDFGSGVANCAPLYGTPNCITHLREQIHVVAGMPDALTHTHSFWLEARVCQSANNSDGKDNTKCGIYRGGGHVGFGRFGTTRFSITEPGQQELLPFMYTDGPSKISDLDGNGKIDEWDYYYLRPDNSGAIRQGGIRLHGAMASDDVHANAHDFTWYPEGRPSMVAVVGTSFGPLLYTPKNVSYTAGGYNLVGPEWSQIRRMVYYCADPTKCRWPNGSQMEAHFIILRVPTEWDGNYFDEDKSKNGFFTFHGFTNRYGDLLTNGQCANSPLGADCVPTEYSHVPVADADTQHRDSSSNTPMYNYDITPSGKYWVQFPN